jgi:predicted ester cyclase
MSNAPFVLSAAELQSAKDTVWAALAALPGPDALAACHAHLAPDCHWQACYPIELLTGPRAVAEGFFSPLAAAFPDLERRLDIFMAGHWDGRYDADGGGAGYWVSCTGHYLGTFAGNWLGIPATGEAATLRFGEFYRVVNGRIAEARIILDIVDLARQAGHRILPPCTGLETWVPGPQGHTGLMRGASDPAAGQHSLSLVENMIGGLMRFDQTNLKSMGMARHWRSDMMWYGPGGIGTARGISGFERHHQKPFLHAFPDRKGGTHRARLGEGAFVASTGWPSVRATHLGDYLGVPASGKPIQMRVMDWWRSEGDLLVENWVFIDLPHLMQQLGVDLLARLPKSAPA